MGSYISGGKIFVKPHLTSYRFDCGLSHHFVAFADIFLQKALQPYDFSLIIEMWFQLSSLRSILNVSTALRRCRPYARYAKRKSYKVLFWREITHLLSPFFWKIPVFC